jgi:hypothetical protein
MRPRDCACAYGSGTGSDEAQPPVNRKEIIASKRCRIDNDRGRNTSITLIHVVRFRLRTTTELRRRASYTRSAKRLPSTNAVPRESTLVVLSGGSVARSRPLAGGWAHVIEILSNAWLEYAASGRQRARDRASFGPRASN